VQHTACSIKQTTYNAIDHIRHRCNEIYHTCKLASVGMLDAVRGTNVAGGHSLWSEIVVSRATNRSCASK
jgi:hypothetical protein